MMPLAKLKTKPNPKQVSDSWGFTAIGTQWWVGIFGSISTVRLDDLQRAVAARIEKFDITYSRFREDSLVTRISNQAGSYQFPDDSRALLDLYKRLYEATDGAVTPLIGDMLVAAGYDAKYSFEPKRLSAVPAWDEVLTYHDTILDVERPVTLDFGAAGKGYLTDLLAECLRDHDINHFCIDAGGDMLVCNDEPFRVGLEHPDDPRQVIGVAELKDCAIAGSARNRRAWAEYHHIMDPSSLRSSRGIKAVWVTADSGLLADGLATALFFLPPERLTQFSFEYVIISDVNQYKHSSAFPAELFQGDDA